jgi:hypothetical protein
MSSLAENTDEDFFIQNEDKNVSHFTNENQAQAYKNIQE